MRVLVFGNGLSIGATGGALTMPELTDALWAWLEAEGLDEFVLELQEWARPQLPALDPDAHQQDFELVAGSLYRLGRSVEALSVLPGLPGLGPVHIAGLQAAAEHLGRLYQRIVAWILREVDRVSTAHVEWGPLNAMAHELRQLHGRAGMAHLYTLNYDGLLMSSMLYTGKYCYDGFRGNELNDPLDTYDNPTLYALHGSTGIYRDAAGVLAKVQLEDLRTTGQLDRWVNGVGLLETPAVVLGDSKESDIQLAPFSTFYAQLELDLLHPTVEEVVVGGYGFGDRPLNRVLANFLAVSPGHRVRDWRPEATTRAGATLASLHDGLPLAVANRIQRAQLITEDNALPNAAAVAAL